MENTVFLSCPVSVPGAAQETARVSEKAPEAAPSADVLRGMTGRTVPRPEASESPAADPPRAARRAYPRRRFGVPVLYALDAAAGTAMGVFLAAYAPAGTDFTGSLLCCPGEFLWLTIMRLLWGLAFLAGEYILGYFALGKALVWLVPLACGLGTGAALTAAFSVYGAGAVKLIPTCAVIAAAVVYGARVSGDMSSQLLRLVSSGRNSVVAVVSESPAAGEYTLRFLVCLAAVAGSAIAEAAVRSFS